MNTNIHFWSNLAQLFLEERYGQKLERKKAHFMFNFFFSKIVPFMRLWKNLWSRKDHRWKHGSCAFPTGHLRLQTHSEYVILIVFPLQHWLHKRASVLRYLYNSCLVNMWFWSPLQRDDFSALLIKYNFFRGLRSEIKWSTKLSFYQEWRLLS